jgi:hypothetical protein
MSISSPLKLYHFQAFLIGDTVPLRKSVISIFSLKNFSWSQKTCPGTILNFFFNIRVVIHICNQLPGNEYTRESIRIFLVRKILQT